MDELENLDKQAHRVLSRDVDYVDATSVLIETFNIDPPTARAVLKLRIVELIQERLDRTRMGKADAVTLVENVFGISREGAEATITGNRRIVAFLFAPQAGFSITSYLPVIDGAFTTTNFHTDNRNYTRTLVTFNSEAEIDRLVGAIKAIGGVRQSSPALTCLQIETNRQNPSQQTSSRHRFNVPLSDILSRLAQKISNRKNAGNTPQRHSGGR
jgi:hypothetical protein